MFKTISIVITVSKALAAAAAAYQKAKAAAPDPTDELQKIENALTEAEAALSALVATL